jgi:YD repeat-containing protein
MGNLIKETFFNGHYGDYQYNNLNQLVKTRDTMNEEYTYTYDSRGNRLGDFGLKENRLYTYTLENQLAEGTNWKSDKSAYAYNALGIRVNNTQTAHSGQVYDRDFVIDYTTVYGLTPTVQNYVLPGNAETQADGWEDGTETEGLDIHEMLGKVWDSIRKGRYYINVNGRKSIIIVSIISILIGISFCIYLKNEQHKAIINKDNFTEPYFDESIYTIFNPIFIGSSDYTPAYFYEYDYFVEGSQITFWEFIPGIDWLNKELELFGLTKPNGVDAERNKYIISYGRRILEMWTEKSFYNSSILSVTFEDKHYGNKAFFYQTDFGDLSIRASRLDSPTYLMVNDTKVLIGNNVRALNQVDTNAMGIGK